MKKQILKSIPLLLILVMMIPVFPAIAAPAGASVTVTPDKLAKTGIPGSIVTYLITVKNSTADVSSLTVTASNAGGWTAPVVVPAAFNLTAAGDTADNTVVTVNVPIPSSATSGQNEITTVAIVDSTHSETSTIQLTTTASQPASVGRPLIIISSYSTGEKPIYAGREMDLVVGLRNDGQTSAYNVVIAFNGTDFYPRETGGVRSGGQINPGEINTVSQKFLLGDALAWQGVGSISATVSYTDAAGTAYNETFAISIKINAPNIVSSAATATPNVPMRPQLVVTGYTTDVDVLQPGSLFELKLDIKNLGMADANAVTVVLGGGVAPNESGTPQPGGLSGASGDLANFAPIGSSNLIVAGNIQKDTVITVSQKLVVNVSTAPGAYPLKLSFVYNDPKGNRLVDDQVITLLVYSLPQVEVSFYRDAGVFTAGMDNILPLQVTNLGKKSFVLGNMKVTAENAEVMNNVSLVGALDPGGYFTLDANLIPMQEGPLEIKVSINYTDDFNQPRFIEQVIPIEVLPMVEITPDMGEGSIDGQPGGEVIDSAPETFWAKVWRFIKGLLGLDSGSVTPEEFIPTEQPIPVKGIPKG